MDTNIRKQDVYEKIFTQVTQETNRVLEFWQRNGTAYYWTEINSLFRTYMSKIVTNHLGWQFYKRYVKNSIPQCIIKDNRLVGISMESMYDELDDFLVVLSTFKFKEVKDTCFTPSKAREIAEDFNPKIVSEIINYSEIEKIKF